MGVASRVQDALGARRKITGHVDFALPTAEGLLLIGWCSAPGEVAIEIALASREAAAAAVTRRYARDDVAQHLGRGTADGERYGFVAHSPVSRGKNSAGAMEVQIRVGGNACRTQAEGLETVPEEQRAALLQQWRLVARIVTEELGVRPSPALMAGVARLQVETATAVRFHVDYCAALPGLGYFVIGWLIDPLDEVRSLILHDSAGFAGDLLAGAERVARPDVLEGFKHLALPPGSPGIVALVRTGAGPASTEVSVYASLASGEVLHERVKVATVGSVLEFSKIALGTFPTAHARMREVLDGHIGPALEHLHEGRSRRRPQAQVKRYGAVPVRPRVSVIVPLYGRHDLMRVQLALFADDAAMRDAELIYVVDDPRLLDEVLQLAPPVAELFQVPFAVVHCGRNLGYAGANNLGAVQARGGFLCLLNSDVMPREAGWLARLVDALAALPDAGVVAPALVFEDGSLQHGGMQLEELPQWGGLWANRHPGKGLPPDGARKPRTVQAVTGACMVMRTELYRRLGGLDEGYLVGDFEDSDLCVRAASEGQRSYVIPEVVLYHLERQSQALFDDPQWRAKLSLFNAWRQARRLKLESRA